MAQVELKKLRKSYGSVETIHGVDLAIEDKEFCVLVGPSGCGKSTLLRMIAGLETITSGELFIAGEEMGDVDAAKRGVAMVFQSYALYPHMTVRENVGFGLKMLKRSKSEIAERVQVASQILQLDELLDRKPSQLSGGQRQRVAIGRAIVRNPKVFLFDEPLSNLDAELRASMRVELAKLHHQIGATMIYVTHDQVEAMTMADKIVVLNKGRIEQVGTPLDLYDKPRNLFVAGFIGSPKMNFVKGAPAQSFGATTIGIRPEDLALSSSEGMWKGKVAVVEHLGSDTFCHLQSDVADNLIVRVPGSARLSHDDEIWITPDAGKIHKFDGDGAAI